MPSDLKFAVYGVRHSVYSHAYLSRLLQAGIRPFCIISIDSSLPNQAASRTLMTQGGTQYPLNSDAWERGDARPCLLELAAEHEIPYLAVSDFQCPKLELYLRQSVPAVILATDGPIMRGPLLYAAKYGILSVHAAQLPTFRGNWTTYFNLYHNLPLVVSAFIMQPWVDEGVLLGFRDVAITRGMDLAQINQAAMSVSVDLAIDVLGRMASGKLSTRRQEPWEGETFRGEIMQGALQPAMPLAQQQELAERFAAGYYGFYTEVA
ncbi:hypothetical protein LMG26846_04518 [Achromobacter insuavis]|uniref:hypothetical protein n=1 Tax=Achromobacter insuavis TaxID=1287735 RepID=UPI00146983E4|nr:hypothetical protein [Achromobacter insuavis]CAB3901205.1 hypothetical protein LMG26846_04518 [Achromobacter insuavis]